MAPDSDRRLIHRTDCGMETFTNAVMADLLKNSLETAAMSFRGPDRDCIHPRRIPCLALRTVGAALPGLREIDVGPGSAKG